MSRLKSFQIGLFKKILMELNGYYLEGTLGMKLEKIMIVIVDIIIQRVIRLFG